jgi:hypothetical protein
LARKINSAAAPFSAAHAFRVPAAGAWQLQRSAASSKVELVSVLKKLSLKKHPTVCGSVRSHGWVFEIFA